MTTQMYICLGLFIFLIGGYVFAKKLHTTNGVVALCAIMLTAWSGLVPAKNVLANFANQNVLLITGMFGDSFFCSMNGSNSAAGTGFEKKYP